MKGIAIVAIAICIIAAGTGVAIFVMDHPDTYSIEYVLNYGENSDDNPSSYKAGDSFTFKDPSRDGYTFKGWYTNSDYKNEIKGIDKDTKGNLKIYALWSANAYKITYVLNGGINSSDNPSTYRTGDSFTFKQASKEGYIFTGWYTDDQFTKNIDGVTSDDAADITVYAGWEISSVGTVLTYNMSGEVKSNSFITRTNTIAGSISYSFLYYKYEKGYLMSYSETYEVTYQGGAKKSFTDSDTYWTKETDDLTWTLSEETETITTIHGEKECEVWIGNGNNEIETQYVGIDDGITYIMNYSKISYDSSTQMSYELMGVGTIEIDKEYEVKAYCDSGITVTGAGVNDAYSEVVLKATASSGTTFSGWYSMTGTLLSTSRTYTIDTLLSDITVCAMNDNSCDVSFNTTTVNISPAVPLTDVEWTFDDVTSKTVVSDTLNYTFSSPGEHTVTYKGKTGTGTAYYGILGVLTDGYVVKHYSWKYNSTTYNTDLSIKYSDFKEYRDDDIYRGQGTDAHNLEFVTYDDPYIIALASNLRSLVPSLSELDFANFILKFTQYIEYVYDEESMGQDEYWKYPLETLYDQNGDCEDTSILFCALAKASGYECCEILFTGHMAAGVVISGYSGENVFVKNGTTYNYCETTNYDSVGSYIRNYGFIDYKYTQYGKGSLFQKLIPVVETA